MAEKSEKKMEVMVEGKYILAAFDVPKSERKHLEGRRILQGVHVRVDKDGRWMVEGCDSYKLARISNGYVGGKHEWFDFTLPPETVTELKAGDLLTFEPGEDMLRCKLVRLAKGNVTEWEFNLLEGKYPNTDQLVPEAQPFGCYRYAHEFNADYLAVLMGVVKKALGKGEGVVFSVQEGKPNRPVVGYAGDGSVEVTLLIMPQKLDEHHKFGNPAPIGNDAKAVKGLRDELKAAQANEKLWKEMYQKLEAKQGEVVDKGGDAVKLAEELEKVKAERDKFAEKFRAEKAKRVEQKGDGKLKDRVKELEAELKAARKELEDVWKENERLKRPADAPKPPKAPQPKGDAKPAPESDEVAAAEVSLSFMDMDAEGAERCMAAIREVVKAGLESGTVSIRWKGKTQAPIRVEGDTLPFHDELDNLGLRWAGKKKYWYLSPTMPKSA